MRHVISCSVSTAPSQTIKDIKKGVESEHHKHQYKKEVESDEPVPNNHKTIARINSCSKHVEFSEESFCDKPICVACLNADHIDHKWKPKNKYIEHIGDSAQNKMPVVRKQLASIIKDCEQRTEATITQLASTENTYAGKLIVFAA